MDNAAPRRTSEGLTRLTAFTDAVVAIAFTLLVLPLTDLAGEVTRSESVWTFLGAHDDILISFAVSFAVIWVLWRQHHQLLEYFTSYDEKLIQMHFVWLFTIVVMPFATALLDSAEPLRWASALYIGILLLSVTMLVAMRWWGLRHPELLEPDSRDDLIAQGVDLTSPILLTAALVISVIWPDTGQWPLLLLFLAFPIGHLTSRRAAARKA